jgi:hypothetical protein
MLLLQTLCALTWLVPTNGGGKTAIAWRILTAGTFHGCEVKSEETGETWLGLFRDGAGWTLRGVEIVVRPAVDIYLDRDSDLTGAQVFVPGVGPEPDPEDWDFACNLDAALDAGQPAFLLQPTEAFPAGSRNVLGSGSPDILPGMTVPLGDSARIRASGRALYLEAHGRRQCLGGIYPDSQGETVRLVWAGDLDGDGRVDLVLDDRPHYAISSGYRLFLSGVAPPKALVREVASFTTVSC